MKHQNVLRILALVMTIAMMLSVASCFGGKEETTTAEKPAVTTPATTTPVATTPQATTPQATTPEQTTPEATTPEQTTPEQTTPEQTTPEQTTPEQTTPEQTTPEQTTPEQTTPEQTTPEQTTPDQPGPDDPVVECETHSYQVTPSTNTARFEKTWGVCTVCGYVDDEHTHKIENGVCVYCDYEFYTTDVISKFDADGDGANDVYKFSAALPEKFNDAIRLDAYKDAVPGGYIDYDEMRSSDDLTKMPYAHSYCSDGDASAHITFNVTVEKAGIYEVAVHIRLKDNKERGATFVINEGTAYEQKIPATYGWATADEATMVRDSAYLQSAYYTGLSFALQAGENTISIKVADGVAKSQHFRDLYLVMAEVECETHSYEETPSTNPARFEKTWGVCTVCGYVDDEHTHKIEDGVCVYCDYEFYTSDVVSKFDADGDGANDIYKFSAALPEEFNNALRLDAYKDPVPGGYIDYDEMRTTNDLTKMPYAHSYCSDGDASAHITFNVTVEKAGIYAVAVHIRLKDNKERGATFVINEGTANEQKIPATYGWATADEATMVRDSAYLQSAYYTGLSFALQAGENTISIKVADGVAKSQHFRDLYLLWTADLPVFECETHSYQVTPSTNTERFEKTWGVCSVCGYVDDEHTHKIENGVCVYCDYEFYTTDVVSKFDADGDGANDIYKFSAALPEEFNNALRLDAYKDPVPGGYIHYDEMRSSDDLTKMPYAHSYCSDGDASAHITFNVTVEKAGIYAVAVHIRLKDNKERGATFVINEGTANEQKIPATYGWATADEATMVRDSAYLQSAYYTGLSFLLQEGENTISIKVADGVAKSQHFRDLYLLWTADLPVVECETHSYQVTPSTNTERFEKTWGVCSVCGYVDDEHTHKIENGVCVYCDYEFYTTDVVSKFDADGDGANDVYKFSAALPEKFNDAIRLDAYKDPVPGGYIHYDEMRSSDDLTKMPYAHSYCSDGDLNAHITFNVTVEKAGIYEVAVHIRLKDNKERGATFVINEGTAYEQKIPATYGWATADEATMVRDSAYLQSAYYTGLSFALQAGENTISIKVAEGVAKSQHFRDLYLVWSADLPVEEEPAGPATLTVEEAIALGMTFEKGAYSAEYYYVTLTLDNQVNANGFARMTVAEGLYVTVAGGYLTGDAEGSIKVGDTVTFLAKVGAANSALTTGGKELRLYDIQSWEIVPAN